MLRKMKNVKIIVINFEINEWEKVVRANEILYML
jgi:hypothetical protein